MQKQPIFQNFEEYWGFLQSEAQKKIKEGKAKPNPRQTDGDGSIA